MSLLGVNSTRAQLGLRARTQTIRCFAPLAPNHWLGEMDCAANH
eukprot:SAG22_NODE_19223_length_277_cov_0.578652_2_plen_43_part_01